MHPGVCLELWRDDVSVLTFPPQPIVSESSIFVLQGSQLAELLVFYGHESDAAKLQGALDGYVKAFIASAEDMLSTPAPPANASPKAIDDAKKTSVQLQVKLHGLKTASWKWSLLRPVVETGL